MFPQFVPEFFSQHQNVLWFMTVCIDLGMTLVLYRLFGRQGLYSVIVLNIILMNLQGPKLTTIFGMQTSLGMIIYSTIVWWGLFGFQTALQLALAKYFFKVIIAALDTPFIYWARSWDVRDKDWVAESS